MDDEPNIICHNKQTQKMGSRQISPQPTLKLINRKRTKTSKRREREGKKMIFMKMKAASNFGYLLSKFQFQPRVARVLLSIEEDYQWNTP